MEDGYDDYPLLDFELSDEVGTNNIYAEDQVVIGPDGPEIAPFELSWDSGDSDDDDIYDDDMLLSQSGNDKNESEEFYVLSESELSCCYEEWEEYC